MSSGTPIVIVVGGGMIRQRHSQGSNSGSEDIDLEDDACSRPPTSVSSSSSTTMAVSYKARTWTHVMENILWITSAVFVLYFGDMKSNLIFLLFFDDRINRKALYFGVLSIMVNNGIILYSTTTVKSSFKSSEKYTVLPSAVALITIIGLLSFCLFSMSLWPIWGFLTLPLLLTLFMAFMVVSPYLPIGPFKPQSLVLHLS